VPRSVVDLGPRTQLHREVENLAKGWPSWQRRTGRCGGRDRRATKWDPPGYLPDFSGSCGVVPQQFSACALYVGDGGLTGAGGGAAEVVVRSTEPPARQGL